MPSRARLAFILFLLLGLILSAPALASPSSRVTPTVQVVRQAGPAVVNINTTSRARVSPFQTGDQALDRFFQEFLGPLEREQASLGSGVIIDGKAGLIATNYHVISRATQIRVQLADRRTFTAQVVGADPSSDLAVLRISSRQSLPQARLGDSSDLMIGESVIAIGNPFGLSHTVTTGVISALDRRVRTAKGYMSGLVQTDASINPGNSGGPLLNADGEVIAINTAIFSHAQGIGFAIPVNRIKRVVSDLVRYGEVIPAWLGLELQDLTPALARAFGLRQSRGVVVVEVMPESPAARAGLSRGQIIVAFNGRQIGDTSDYGEALAAVRAGDQVSLDLVHQGQSRQVRLDSRAFPLERAMELAWRLLGFSVRRLDKDLARRHRVAPNSAVAIERVRPGSRAAAVGLRSGDLVLRLGSQPTPNLGAFQREMARNRLLNRFTVLVRRGPISQYITLGR